MMHLTSNLEIKNCFRILDVMNLKYVIKYLDVRPNKKVGIPRQNAEMRQSLNSKACVAY